MNNTRVIVKRAEREGIKTRIALVAPTGFGKTWTALSLATELQGDLPILGIDTEKRSMGLYGHVKTCPADCTDPKHFTFEWLPWEPPYSPEELTLFLEAEAHNYGAIVIDSFSHFWQGEGGTKDQVDNIAKRASQGSRPDTFSAWKEGTSIQDRMIGAILGAPCHMICCFRVKMAYERVETNEGGRRRTEIRKLGLNPIQRDDVEYEFTVIAEMTQEHHMVIQKTRCDALDRRVFPPHHQREVATVLLDWLGEARSQPTNRLTVDLAEARARVLVVLGEMDKQRLRKVVGDAGYPGGGQPLGEWLTASGRDTVVGLIATLRLPLTITPEPTPQEPAPQLAEAVVAPLLEAEASPSSTADEAAKEEVSTPPPAQQELTGVGSAVAAAATSSPVTRAPIDPDDVPF